MKPFNIFIILSLILIFGGFFIFSNGSNPTPTSAETKNSADVNFDLSSYVNYSPSAQNAAQQRGNTVLFFAATTWCQTCSALEEEIIERQNEIPSEITILKVDYDNDKAMNQKWSVTSQHTLIVLDQNGEEVTRWLGGGFDSLLQQIEEV